MKVGVLCEFSGTVRDAFIRQGHDAHSYDLLPTESEGPHFQGDLLKYSRMHWEQYDLIICHPPCTYLATSGARWFKYRQKEQEEALNFVRYLLGLPVECIALENPISVISTKIRKPDQIIQPYQFGHPEKKSTCLWLKNLPKLEETNNVRQEMLSLSKKEQNKMHYVPPSKDRWKIRSRTYTGIADAMAKQWGKV